MRYASSGQGANYYRRARVTRVAVVGTGYWGRNLVRNFHELGALAGLYDSDESTVTALTEIYGATKTWSSSDAVFEDPKIDAVAIATPAATHGALAKRALNAGKSVFVEKPLCLDLGEAAELRTLVADSDQVLMVGHLMLYHPAFQALQLAVEAGRIGDLRYIYSNRASLGKIRREENALWSFAPHDISMILALAGRMPDRIVCNGGTYLREGVADTTLSHFSFAGNLQAHIFVSWLHPYKDHRMVVVGSEGMIVFDDVRLGEEKLQLYFHEIGWEGDIPSVIKADGRPISYADEEPLRNECRHFLDCVSSGEQPRSDAEEGNRVLFVLDACQNSLSEGCTIEVSYDE
jgi:UDP-2-acetamido-3-amino-2,3-dideoxy-glucuronate N-acetyltransferase